MKNQNARAFLKPVTEGLPPVFLLETVPKKNEK
jgi:hypothetical protein